MVRLIRVTDKRGRIVWEEDAPTVCPAGHEGAIVPSHGGCPVCSEPVRLWLCRADKCTAPVQYDDEHVHDSRKRPGGRLPDPGLAAICAHCGEPREAHAGPKHLGACPGRSGLYAKRFALQEQDKP